ncbi:S41 family peptidase [Alicyclobacillus tolerans]|uniref:S41 family peptidase n=1 Tax=Alicyclobacillus tolerans TaxID=90970 RepID=UPI001F3DFD51|nr:S41 family peptidase [Alicyclobacillus tolerans]MCF8563841.1 S41 family peptidase [Alicyclobacillus tolerans]
MSRKAVPIRPLLAGVAYGVILGALLTIGGLKAFGVSFQPQLSSPEFQKFFAVYHDLRHLYYQPLSESTLLEAAVNGMVKTTGDPFTDYFTPAAAKSFQNMLSNSFDGIGVGLKTSQMGFVVASVTPGSPAQRAGLKPNDQIVKVGDRSVAGLTMPAVAKLIDGPAGTKVVITVALLADGGKTHTYTLTREKISVPAVQVKLLAHRVGYMQIVVVGNNSAAEVASGLKQLRAQGATRLILDLRGNPGGYLDQAKAIAAQFIAQGKVILKVQNRGQAPQPVVSKGPGLTMPIVVLVDGNTASAAEVLAAALRADDGAKLVGTTTFGKGTVQETQVFPDGSSLKYTVAHWLTPDGQWIEHQGLKPDVAIANPNAQLTEAEQVVLQEKP